MTVSLVAGSVAATVIIANASTGSKSPTHPRKVRLPEGYKKWVRVTGVDAPVFNQFEPGRKVIGRIRRGSQVAARPARTERTCHAHDTTGLWLETPSGFICTSYGMQLGIRQAPSGNGGLEFEGLVPFDYVKVTQVGTGRYKRPRSDSDLLVERQSKAFFLAKDGVIRTGKDNWVRTTSGEFVLAAKTRPVRPSKFQGTALTAKRTLPLAFVVGPDDELTLRCRTKKGITACGRAKRFTTFMPKHHLKIGDTKYVVDQQGRMYPSENVRIARKIRRPDDVPRKGRWVHIALDQQVFVAYAGNTPKYASLVSSGVPGHATPPGLYRTQRKYLTKTMKGPDETHGRYRVEEIPWVLYYKGNYAVHGAYWHEEFGNVRSHGCTNLAPADARWIYEWDQAAMPFGWHANLNATGGLFFYFTNQSA